MKLTRMAKWRLTDTRDDGFVPGTPAERIGLVWAVDSRGRVAERAHRCRAKTTKTYYTHSSTRRLSSARRRLRAGGPWLSAGNHGQGLLGQAFMGEGGLRETNALRVRKERT